MFEKLKKLAELEDEILKYFGVGHLGTITDYTDVYWYATTRDVSWGEKPADGEEFKYGGELLNIFRQRAFTLAVIDHGCGGGVDMGIFDNTKIVEDY